MPKSLTILALGVACLCPAVAQTPPAKKATAREMYFAGWDDVRRTPKAVRTAATKTAISTKPAEVPLGLRYTLLKRAGPDTVEIPPSAVFRTGDRIQLGVEANDNAYLYIVHQGSSGKWQVMFPSAGVAAGNNRLEKGKRYIVPEGYAMTFQGEPGMEKLFLVLSRQPEPDLDNLIYSLQNGAPRPPAPTLMASARPIENTVVDNIRRTYARDLVIEKIVDEAPGPKVENAVYVVNPTGRQDSRVVTDIELTHR